MTKKADHESHKELSPPKEDKGLAPLVTELRGLIHSARHAVATKVNILQVRTNFEIGRRIVEQEQKGAERAEYGKELLKDLSVKLSAEFGNGFSPTNLRLIRQFFLDYRDRIGQTPTDLFPITPICQTVSDKFKKIVQAPYGNSGKPPFTLSWSHYLPSKELLQQKLVEWVREEEVAYGAERTS